MRRKAEPSGSVVCEERDKCAEGREIALGMAKEIEVGLLSGADHPRRAALGGFSVVESLIGGFKGSGGKGVESVLDHRKLHLAAADGTALATVGSDPHLCALCTGRVRGIVNDDGKKGRVPRFKNVEERSPKRKHPRPRKVGEEGRSVGREADPSV